MDDHEPMRLSVADAAKLLSVTPEAIRQRIRRSTIEHEKTEDGRVYVYVTRAEAVQDGVGNTDHTQLFERMSSEIDYLREALRARDRELAEMRRLVAGALEKIPALEPPPDTPSDAGEAPQTPSKSQSDTQAPQGKEQRSWWQRWFGG